MLICGHIYIYRCNWINPPHDKIALCVCDERKWFFWFNSDPRVHGEGQLQVARDCHAAITKDCYLDLGSVKAVSEAELAAARDIGPISDALRADIEAALANPIRVLPEMHRTVARDNLSSEEDEDG